MARGINPHVVDRLSFGFILQQLQCAQILQVILDLVVLDAVAREEGYGTAFALVQAVFFELLLVSDLIEFPVNGFGQGLLPLVVLLFLAFYIE